MQETDLQLVEIIVEKSDAGSRLDVFTAKNFPHCSRKRARKACLHKKVFVDGTACPPGYLLQLNQKVKLDLDFPLIQARAGVVSKELLESFSVSILYEDESLLVANKPREMFSVTLRPEDPPTLADCIAAYSNHCRDTSKDPREAGLVQRLDFYTSGAAMAAKSQKIWDQLHHMILSDLVTKTYYAIVEGNIFEEKTTGKVFSISTPLVSGTNGKMRTATNSDKPKDIQEAFSLVMPVKLINTDKTDSKASLVKIISKRTRRHQIRVHLASTGYPLCGDSMYGSKTTYFRVPDSKEEQEGFFLHAAGISLVHPLTNDTIDIEATHPIFSEAASDSL